MPVPMDSCRGARAVFWRMPPILKSAPTPRAFAEAYAREIFAPAARAAAGTNGKLSVAEARNAATVLTGPLSLAAGELARLRNTVGSADVERLVEAARAEAERGAAGAAGSDGKLSFDDSKALGDSYKAAYAFLRGREGGAPPPSPPPLRFSDRVMDDVCRRFGVTRDALLARAGADANADGYLGRTELEQAARGLGGGARREHGIVSDIDKTVMPPETAAGLARAYPGVAALFRELEFGFGWQRRRHVLRHRTQPRTHRGCARVDAGEQPARRRNLHRDQRGAVDCRAREDFRDVYAIFDANPGQKFVLVGDSSHRDPEVYRAIQAKYPDQVLAVLIHNVKNIAAARVVGQTLVGNYAEGAAALFKQGVLDEAAARRVMTAARTDGLVITDAEMDALLAP